MNGGGNQKGYERLVFIRTFSLPLTNSCGGRKLSTASNHAGRPRRITRPPMQRASPKRSVAQAKACGKGRAQRTGKIYMPLP